MILGAMTPSPQLEIIACAATAVKQEFHFFYSNFNDFTGMRLPPLGILK